MELVIMNNWRGFDSLDGFVLQLHNIPLWRYERDLAGVTGI
jgi:hypothetical protein